MCMWGWTGERPVPRREMMAGLARMIGAPPPRFAENGTGRRAQNKRGSSRKIVDAGFRFSHPDFESGYRQIMTEEGVLK